MMFADVVKGYSKNSFERILDKIKEEKEGYNPKLKKKTLYFRNKVYVDKNISLFK